MRTERMTGLARGKGEHGQAPDETSGARTPRISAVRCASVSPSPSHDARVMAS